MKIKVGFINVILCFLCLTAYATESSLHEQRARFQKWQQTFSTTTDENQKKQLLSLKGYPLYPYVEYQYLSTHIEKISPNEINQFVSQNGDFPLVAPLMQNYIETLTKQKEWKKITTLKIDNSLASRCRYQFAQFKLDQKEKAFQSVKDIWLSGDDLPAACDPLFEEWGKTSEKSANLILLRIELVLKKNNIKLARYLTSQLPDNYKTLKKNLFALYDDPKKLADFSKNINPSSFSKNIVISSFSRLVNADVNSATKILPTLVKQQKLTKENEISLLRNIAVNYFKDSSNDEQKKWRDQFIVQNKDTLLIERRIRMALKENNLKDVQYWLSQLPKKDSQKDEWRYWQAVILMNENKAQEAQKILTDLAKGRGFYAMYSAQKLNLPFQFDFNYSVMESASPQVEAVLLKEKYKNDIVIKRIEELRFWGMLSEASREWRHYLYTNNSEKKYAELARYSYINGWGEHSIQATIAGKLWDNWVERFPIVYQDIFNESLNEKTIQLSYAMAIARQESALDATVISPAGARGLMQLMPGTAKDSAKKVTGITYTSANQLYDPKINIQLGTYYLDYVYQQFNNNRILASAAYNAGPNRVNRWLKETQGKLDPIAFIESIPFTETRNYVKSVLVYDYIYQTVLQNKPKTILTKDEVIQKY